MGLLDFLIAQDERIRTARQGAADQRAEDLRARERARLAGETQSAGVGIAQQMNREGLGPGQPTQDAAGNWQPGKAADPNAARAIGLMMNAQSRPLGVALAAEQMDPQKQATLADTLASTGGRGASLALDQQRTAAYLANMSYDNAAKVTAANLQALQGALKNEGDLRAEYQKAPLLLKGAQAISSWQMMKRALDQDNQMALQSAIVGAAQIQEPGLAVRNDDRIAYTGSNPVVDQLVQTFNTATAGEGLTPGTKRRLLALGTQLAGVHARNIQQVTREYQRLAIGTPGARMDQVTSGVGFDWDLVNFLSAVTEPPRSGGPGGR